MASSKGKSASGGAKKKPAKKAGGKANAVSTLPVPVARKLLELLSTDDGFRRRFMKNPHAGLLESAGIDPQIAACAKPEKLASKKDIAAAHDELLEMLTCRVDQTPVKLSV